MLDKTPTIDRFRPVVLSVLSDGHEQQLKAVCDRVADCMQLGSEIRSEKISSGQSRYINRISWACLALTHAGSLERLSRGHYRLTEDGQIVNQRRLKEYSETDMLECPAWRAYQEEIAARKRIAQGGAIEASTKAEENGDPLEVLMGGERAFNAETETELRKRLQESSPEFFERAVIDLLWAMGYSGAYGEKGAAS